MFSKQLSEKCKTPVRSYFSKLPARLLIALSLILFPASYATNKLPEIGTAGVSALSVQQELQYGVAFIKVARASFPIINDPVLNEYIADIGGNLVSQADSVRFPFNFFLVQDNEINAAAFLGGYVKVHTGLFLYADTESELASVLAHEISHVTQRHLARSLEAQAGNNKLTVAGMVGSVLLAIANPVAGIAALQTTVAINAQTSINYTRSNEYEADRIGIQVMANAGYNPEDMAKFFGKLSEQYRFSSKVPQMLITHPLPTTRVAEARDRATRYPKRYYQPSLNFQLAKARIQVRYSALKAEAALNHFEGQLKTKKFAIKEAALYGKALALLQLNRAKEAKSILVTLSANTPNNLFYIDSLTDADLALKDTTGAIARLEKASLSFSNNQVIVLNRVVALKQAKRYPEATQLLRRYIQNNETDIAAIQIYIELLELADDKVNMFIQRANLASLRANYDRAEIELLSAKAFAESPSDIARIQALVKQTDEEKQQMQELQN